VLALPYHRFRHTASGGYRERPEIADERGHVGRLPADAEIDQQRRDRLRRE
jgi:hypothetical protein